MEKYDDLYKRIIGRLNSSRIENTREVVSAKFVEDSVRYTMEQYNNALIKNQAETIKLMNKSLGYTFFTSKGTKKEIARVVSIINKVTEDGNVYSVVVLEDGNTITLSGNYKNVYIVNSTLTGGQIVNAVAKWKYAFCVWFGALEDFAFNFPGVEMNFGENVKNVHDQEINDGFMKCTVSMTEPEKTYSVFSSIEDHMLSVRRCKKYGELYDYVAFYNDEIKAKMGVSVDKLNPFVKSCVLSHLSSLEQSDDSKLTLSK